MNGFDVQPIGRFAGSSAAIRRPKVRVGWPSDRYHGPDIAQEITCFSYDDEHGLHLDGSSLRYYYPPRLGADLSQGFETFQKLDDSADEHLDSLLTSIMALEKETGTRCDADIVTWRGMITKVRDPVAATDDRASGVIWY